MPVKVFAVHPGCLRSRNDQEEHFISFSRLCELYGAARSLCVDMSRPEQAAGMDVSRLVHLYPSPSGRYSPPGGGCPWDRDGDRECPRCEGAGGCPWPARRPGYIDQ